MTRSSGLAIGGVELTGPGAYKASATLEYTSTAEKRAFIWTSFILNGNTSPGLTQKCTEHWYVVE